MLTGIKAAIKWQYYDAAILNGYTIERDKDTRKWFVRGHIVTADPFKLSQSPLRLVVPYDKGQWIWPIISAVPRSCGPFTAALGAPLPRPPVNVHVDPHTGIRTP